MDLIELMLTRQITKDRDVPLEMHVLINRTVNVCCIYLYEIL